MCFDSHLSVCTSQIKQIGNLGLGCGNPFTDADIAVGEVVLDLGSGAGFDCFLASRMVGKSGSVMGVDMTPKMVSLARSNARDAVMSGHPDNVSFVRESKASDATAAAHPQHSVS